MAVTPTQVALVVIVVGTLSVVLYDKGRNRWQSMVADRFVYGVPWGTLVIVGVNVVFYLLAQYGLRHWSDPLTFPFITWSYFYPIGLFTAGLAHGSPGHLVANMTGTLAFAPIAEYAWGHYAPSSRAPLSSGDEGGLVTSPWIRALVVFPGALFVVAVLTGVFSLGPGLGFSGAVFAIAGFAVVNYPLTTVIAIVAAGALRLLYKALTQPVVEEAIKSGPPTPPQWAGIGFQAHMLGFLIGVLIGIALLRRRRRRPATERVLFGTLLLGLGQSLWLIVWTSGDDTFVLYRGVGVTLVFVLTMLVTVAVTGSKRSLPRPLSVLPRAPTRRQLAVVWLVAVTLGIALGTANVLLNGDPSLLTLGPLLILSVLLALPALPPLMPDRWLSSPVSRRQTAVACLAVLTALLAVVSIPSGLLAVGDSAVPGSGGVELGGYTVTYEQNATPERSSTIDIGFEEQAGAQQSGVIIVNDDREIWTVAVRSGMLEYRGTETVEVGGFGWRETVNVTRTGWEVVGNETAYAVDLEVDGETTRSFTSDPAQANVVINSRKITVVPTNNTFQLQITANGTAVGTAPIPGVNETATIGAIRFSTETAENGTERVVARVDGTEVQIATRETYANGTDSGSKGERWE